MPRAMETAVICDLCGLPLQHTDIKLIMPAITFRFCCAGCRQVFNLLLEATPSADPSAFKQTRLFNKCREIGIIPRTQDELTYRDQTPPVQKTEIQSTAGTSVAHHANSIATTLSLTMKVDNMWCPSCAWIIEAYLKKSSGIISADCNFSTDFLRCDYDPVTTTPDRIVDTIRSLGYRPIPFGEKDSGGKRSDFIRFVVSAFLTANVMMLSFSLYSGFFNELSIETIHNLSWPIFVMSVIVFCYGGFHIYRKALTGLFKAAFGMETLVTIGIVSAFLFSIANLFQGSIHLYFDTTCMLITLVLLGKILEKNAKHAVQADLETFYSLRPAKARICSDQFAGGRYVNSAQLHNGDRFISTENETIAADGLILQGSALIDVSALTGESIPVNVKAGDRVRCGSVVISGSLQISAEAVGNDSTIGQMIKIIEHALDGKTKLEGKTDKILQWFIPVILLLAGATGAVCLLSGLSFENVIVRVITVLVIACPCSLGIAIPLARVGGISLAGRNGLLVRNFSGFEQAGRVSAFAFDKTGTMTRGRWQMIECIAIEPFANEQILSWALALEKDSTHYIAAAIRRHAGKKQIAACDMKRISIFENGISGYFKNTEIKIGSKHFIEQADTDSGNNRIWGIKDPDAVASTVYMSCGGEPCAVFLFGDEIKPQAGNVVETLNKKGFKTYLLSGDGDTATRAVGEKLCVHGARGGLLPRDKVSFIRSLQAEGARVAMVGDGINDAPALIQADLSIAVHSGSHLGKEVADITLMRSDPLQLIVFLDLSRRVNAKIFQNLLFSFLYNTISIPVAMSGLLNPLIAVSVMLLSSLSVIGNTRLMLRKGTNTATDLSGRSPS